MVLVQKQPFYQPFFFSQYRPENVFYDILERKNGFLGDKKIRNSRSRKIDIFLKGLTHGFGTTMPIFQLFFLGNKDQKNVFYDILERRNAFLGYKNKKFKNSKNSHFCKGVKPWVWYKNGHFSNLFFLVNIDQENVFYNILERKNAFLGYKNKKFKKSKN